MPILRKVTTGQQILAADWNALVDALNSLLGMQGDGLVTVVGSTIGLNLETLAARMPRDPNIVIVKIISNASGGGKYNGRIVVGSSVGTGTTDLAMPMSMAIPASNDCLVFNLFEDGASTHCLKANSYVIGKITGIGSNLVHVVAHSVIATQSSASTVGGNTEGSEAADSTSWARGTPLDLWMMSRATYFEAGDEKLYAYVRKMQFDAAGILYAVSGETRFIVDTPGTCP